MRRLLVALVMAVLVMPISAMAQNATPTIDERNPLSGYMPDPGVFGPQWLDYAYLPEVADNDAFSDGYASFYGGPAGERIQILILQNKTDRASANDAWDIVTGWVDNDSYNDDFDIDYSRRDDLDDMPFPDGVVDAERVDGIAYFLHYPMCSGVYAVDPDLLIYVRVEGRVTLRSGKNNGVNTCDDIATYIAALYKP